MKINCGLGPQAKRERREEEATREMSRLSSWHPWFAWRPVRLDDNDCRWLETVERKFPYVFYSDGHIQHFDAPHYRPLEAA